MDVFRIEVQWKADTERYQALGFNDLRMDEATEKALRRELQIISLVAESKKSGTDIGSFAQSRRVQLGIQADILLKRMDCRGPSLPKPARALAEFFRQLDQCRAIASHLCNAQQSYLRSRNPEDLERLTYLDVSEVFDWNEATSRRAIQRMKIIVDGWQFDADTLMHTRSNPGVAFRIARMLEARPHLGAPSIQATLANSGYPMSQRNVGKVLKLVRLCTQPARPSICE